MSDNDNDDVILRQLQGFIDNSADFIPECEREYPLHVYNRVFVKDCEKRSEEETKQMVMGLIAKGKQDAKVVCSWNKECPNYEIISFHVDRNECKARLWEMDVTWFFKCVKKEIEPLDQTDAHIEVLENRINDLEQKISLQNNFLAAISTSRGADLSMTIPERAHIAGPWWGPILYVPTHIETFVCQCTGVTVTLMYRDFLGNERPMPGANVPFMLTKHTAGTIISSNSKCYPPTGPGGSVAVPTGSRGDATIYIHGSVSGFGVIRVSAPGALSKEIFVRIRK